MTEDELIIPGDNGEFVPASPRMYSIMFRFLLYPKQWRFHWASGEAYPHTVFAFQFLFLQFELGYSQKMKWINHE